MEPFTLFWASLGGELRRLDEANPRIEALQDRHTDGLADKANEAQIGLVAEERAMPVHEKRKRAERQEDPSKFQVTVVDISTTVPSVANLSSS